MRRNKLLMVISRQCSVVGCDEYARLTVKYVAKNKIKQKEGRDKEDVINVDLCYRHRYIELNGVQKVGEFERTPGNITRKEQGQDGPTAKIELEMGDEKHAKVLSQD